MRNQLFIILKTCNLIKAIYETQLLNANIQTGFINTLYVLNNVMNAETCIAIGYFFR